MRALFAAVFLCACARFGPAADLSSVAQRSPTGATATAAWSAASGLNYVRTTPPGFADEPDRRWPLLVFLHGIEDRGRRVGVLLSHPEGEGVGLAHVALVGDGFDFVTISPLCPKGTHWFFVQRRLTRLLEELLATAPLDRRRVVLTGVSMGGMGTWSWGMARPDLFAALVPIAGGIYAPPMSRDVSSLLAVPVWAFHDGADPSIPLGRDARPIARLEALGGEARLTITETGSHYIHPEVYADPALLEWLRAQVKPSPADP